MTIAWETAVVFFITFVLNYLLHPLGDLDSRKNSEPFLLVADFEAIIQVDITSGSKVTLPLKGVGMSSALDYDPITDYVYWSDETIKIPWKRKIKRARRDGSGMETIIDTGSKL